MQLQETMPLELASNNQGTGVGITRLTLGVIELLDADVPVSGSGRLDYNAQVHNGRGRRIYSRALWTFRSRTPHRYFEPEP